MNASSGPLDRKLCQVVGINQNYTSGSGTLYHIQIEDRGPVLDRLTEAEVRRVNLIIEGKVKELAEAARALVEAHEERQIAKIKELLLEYHRTKSESAKKSFE